MTDATDDLQGTKLSEDLNINHPLGREEFLYDLIGINITGLKSMGVLLKRPKAYFDAALSPDWEGKYWPSMRMWFGIMTIMIGLQFLWASENSEMTAMFRMLAGSVIDGMVMSAERDGDTLDFSSWDRIEAGKRMFKIWIFIYPAFFVVAMCALAFIFRSWERKLPYIARVRFIFAIILPGSLIGLATTLLTVPFRGMTFQIISTSSLVFVFAAYWVTAYRGAYAHADKGSALGLSFVISVLILVTVFFAQMLSMIVALLPGIADIMEIARPQIEAIKAAKDPAP